MPRLRVESTFSNVVVVVLLLPALLSFGALLAPFPFVHSAELSTPRVGLNLTFYREAWCHNSSSAVTIGGLSEGSEVDVVSCTGMQYARAEARRAFLRCH